MHRIAFLFLALAATTAHGQVVKCINPATGHATYSDRPCESGQAGKLVERRKSQDEILSERMQAAEANERKYRERLTQAQVQQQAGQQAPAGARNSPVDKSASYECRQARKDHETVSSIRTGTAEERRSRINSSTITVNAACGMTTELMQAPARAPIINNGQPNKLNKSIRCNAGACYDDNGSIYHQSGSGFMTGPNGQACHQHGSGWTCN